MRRHAAGSGSVVNYTQGRGLELATRTVDGTARAVIIQQGYRWGMRIKTFRLKDEEGAPPADRQHQLGMAQLADQTTALAHAWCSHRRYRQASGSLSMD